MKQRCRACKHLKNIEIVLSKVDDYIIVSKERETFRPDSIVFDIKTIALKNEECDNNSYFSSGNEAIHKETIKKFTEIYFKNKVDSSLQTYISILNLYNMLVQKNEIQPQSDNSFDDIILSCFFLYLRTNLINSKENSEEIYKLFSVSKDIFELLEMELKVFQIVNFKLPKNHFKDFIFSIVDNYFDHLKILVKNSKKGKPKHKKTQCLFRNWVVFFSIKFYIYLIGHNFLFNKYSLNHYYFSIFYLVFEKLTTYFENDEHNKFTIFMILMQDIGVNYNFEKSIFCELYDDFFRNFIGEI